MDMTIDDLVERAKAATAPSRDPNLLRAILRAEICMVRVQLEVIRDVAAKSVAAAALAIVAGRLRRLERAVQAIRAGDTEAAQRAYLSCLAL